MEKTIEIRGTKCTKDAYRDIEGGILYLVRKVTEERNNGKYIIIMENKEKERIYTSPKELSIKDPKKIRDIFLKSTSKGDLENRINLLPSSSQL